VFLIIVARRVWYWMHLANENEDTGGEQIMLIHLPFQEPLMNETS